MNFSAAEFNELNASAFPYSERSLEQFRMEVSDDEISKADAITEAAVSFTAAENSSSFTNIVGMDAQHEPHRITPQSSLVYREASSSSRTTTATENNLNKNSLPLLPPIAGSTGDRQTPLTIEKRNSRALNSLVGLVDEYAVNSTARTYIGCQVRTPRVRDAGLDLDESPGHYFNACRDGNPTAGTYSSTDREKGIHKNQELMVNLIPHNFGPLDRERNQCHDRPTSSSNSITITYGITDCNKKVRTRRRESHKTKSDADKDSSNISNTHSKQNDFITTTHSKKNKTRKTSPTRNSNTNTSTMFSKVGECLPRQRSRAIAINRSQPVGYNRSEGQANASEKVGCDAELYDYATWRMYNRIIDHRRKNLLRYPQAQPEGQPSAKEAATNQTVDESAVIHHPSPVVIGGQQYFLHQSQLPYPADEYQEEEDIFDFEL